MNNYDLLITSVYAKTSDSGTRFFKVEASTDEGTVKTFNIFDEKIADALNAAKENRQRVDVTLEQNGKWTNFKSLNTTVVTPDGLEIKPEPPKAKSGFGGAKADPMKAESIERQCALKATVELITNDKVSIDDWERVATSMAKWIHNKGE